MNNRSLYWYGTFAKMKKALGRFLTLFFGLIAFFTLGLNMFVSLFFGIIAISGIILWCYGAEENFDYQQRSGSRIHKGDGW